MKRHHPQSMNFELLGSVLSMQHINSCVTARLNVDQTQVRITYLFFGNIATLMAQNAVFLSVPLLDKKIRRVTLS